LLIVNDRLTVIISELYDIYYRTISSFSVLQWPINLSFHRNTDIQFYAKNFVRKSQMHCIMATTDQVKIG